MNQVKTIEEKREALKRAGWTSFTPEVVDEMSEHLIDHYYDILIHND